MSAVLPSISVEPLETLEPEWAALWARVPAPTPFTHPRWAAAWLGSQPGVASALATRPVIVAVRVEDSLIGVVPLQPGPRVATSLGDPNVTDYATALALPGEEITVAAGVLEWLVEDLTTGLDLWGVPEDSAMRPAFRTAAARFGWTYEEVEEAICPRASLPASFDEYVAALSKHDRHELRRKIRHLESGSAVSFESFSDQDGIRGQLDHFLELMRTSRADKDEFLTSERVEFFRRLTAAFSELGLARLGTLTVDGTAAAMVLSFEDHDATYLYNSGYDPAFAHQAVGLISKAYALREAIARGKRTFDFLRGDEEYKRRLGGEPRQVLTLRLRS